MGVFWMDGRTESVLGPCGLEACSTPRGGLACMGHGHVLAPRCGCVALPCACMCGPAGVGRYVRLCCACTCACACLCTRDLCLLGMCAGAACVHQRWGRPAHLMRLMCTRAHRAGPAFHLWPAQPFPPLAYPCVCVHMLLCCCPPYAQTAVSMCAHAQAHAHRHQRVRDPARQLHTATQCHCQGARVHGVQPCQGARPVK